MKIAGITRGAKGAIFYDGENFLPSGDQRNRGGWILWGAGDSFIAGFLTAYGDKKPIKEALDYAACRSALTCTVRGGFGHPHKA